jgi:5,10-methylene-tetrahydrofolate dehydrogenase/methenyl tetrahydrofolate cyclohydrolase
VPKKSYEEKLQTLIKQVNQDYQVDGINYSSSNPVHFR